MSEPKRHHWWPQLNSGYWCNERGLINVLNRDGSSFEGSPIGLGVVGHLYSKELTSGQKDTSIEKWFAKEIDSPFLEIIKKLSDESEIRRYKYHKNPDKAKVLRQLGYRVPNYVEYYGLPGSEREIVSKYVAALLVRNPNYLDKLAEYHKSSINPKNSALDNMKYLFEIYFQKIMSADFILIKRDAENEFLFSDGGIIAREPWSRNGGIPFDVHFPVTPDLALQILPALKQEFPDKIPVFRATNQGVAAQNRISLQYAKRQVFGRGAIPLEFVMKNWGRAAPQHIAVRHIDGKLETKVDWSRFFY